MIIAYSVNSQVTFYRFYGGEGYDFGHGIVEREDSSYLFTGSTSSFSGNSQMFITSLDKNGNHEWTLDYGGLESEVGRRIFYVQGYGLYVAGYGNSFGAGGFDAYLMFTDLSGNEIWTETYGTSGRERILDAAMALDTGLFMVGETKSSVENEDIYIIRTDKNGDTIWTKTLGDIGVDVATKVARINDTTYLVGGYEYIPDSLMTKGVIYTILDDGTVIDKNVYGNNSDCKIFDFTFVNNQVDAVGTTLGPDDWDNKRWNISYPSMNATSEFVGSGDLKEMNAICYADDGINRYIAYGIEGASSYPDGPDIYLGLFNEQLQFIPLANPLSIADVGVDDVGQMLPTLDKGFIMVGSSYASESEYSKAYVVKVGPGITFPTIDFTVNNIVAISELDQLETEVFPIPVKDILNIRSDKTITNIQIYDSYGRMVLKKENMSSSNLTQLNLDALISGTYIISVEFENNLIGQKRIIKE